MAPLQELMERLAVISSISRRDEMGDAEVCKSDFFFIAGRLYSLNSRPSTLYPRPKTLNLKPLTLHPSNNRRNKEGDEKVGRS